MALNAFGGVYNGLRVLVTGHTGFKGSWLALWLKAMGAEVTGVALPPDTDPSHWDLLHLDAVDRRVDIRNQADLVATIEKARPQVVFHLAAQSLVRKSYSDPVETWSTNVLGTANVLEACRHTPSVRAILVVTTDKCYENREWVWGYRETDRLGGHDPYSASKAAVELLAASYRSSYFDGSGNALVATARAGNVIGGGDWAQDRLIPDLARALTSRTPLVVRYPSATRPWQHVLESLSGYLLLAAKLLEGKRELAAAWNFGPDAGSNRSVSDVLAGLTKKWPEIRWSLSTEKHPHEAGLLWLDSSKAREHLKWKPVWDFNATLEKTADWYREFFSTGKLRSEQQIREYAADARAVGLAWAQS